VQISSNQLISYFLPINGLFTQNIIFVLRRVVRQHRTLLGWTLIWSDAVVRHRKENCVSCKCHFLQTNFENLKQCSPYCLFHISRRCLFPVFSVRLSACRHVDILVPKQIRRNFFWRDSNFRFFLVHDTKTGKNVPNEHKMCQMFIKYSKWA
jgi:hypothetical protein